MFLGSVYSENVQHVIYLGPILFDPSIQLTASSQNFTSELGQNPFGNFFQQRKFSSGAAGEPETVAAKWYPKIGD